MAVNPNVWGIRAGQIIGADGTIVDEAKGYDLTDPANPAKRVLLSGQKAVSITVFDALAITDTTSHFAAALDLSEYTSWSLWVKSTLDQYVKIIPNIFNEGIIYSNGAVAQYIESASGVWDLVTSLAWVGKILKGELQLSVTCDTAPTSGSLSVTIVGRTN